MECRDFQRSVHAYVDAELPAEIRREADAHLAGCEACRQLLAQEQQWRQAVRRAGRYHAAPELVRRRIIALARRQSPASSRAGWGGWRIAASLLVTVGLTSAITAYVSAPSPGTLLEQEIVAGHVRSLQMDHATDVTSSDQHTVKPWFNGKLDYAPPVEDFAAQGFPLAGGRLDYVDRRNVAALLYHHAKHPINLFILPTRAADSAPSAEVDNGYNLLHWTKDGMTFWAISDVQVSDLEELARLLRKGN